MMSSQRELLKRKFIYNKLGTLVPVFGQTGIRLLKTSFKSVLGFTGLHKNLNFKKNSKSCNIKFPWWPYVTI